MTPMMAYSETIDYLFQMQSHGVRPGLARITSLLSLFNHPEQSFKSIHIAGTNGKGSTASMVATVLQESKYQVGLYTSPHILDFSERIQINGRPISQKDVVRLTDCLREKLETRTPRLAKKISFFEFTTGLAFIYFAEKKVDFAVVEVGLGGKYDATNLLRPLVSSITNIDLDHEQYLGSTISEVASEKAGIIKEAVPVVSSASQPEVISIIKEVARLKKAPLLELGGKKSASLFSLPNSKTLAEPLKVHYSGIKEYFIELPLLGKHQVENTATTMGILESLQEQGLHISESDIIEGFKKVRLAGRLEIIQKDPLILLDGAHNPAGTRALGAFLNEIDPEHQGKHWLISGIMKDKHIRDMISPLISWTDEFVLTRPEIKRAANPKEIGEITSALFREGLKKRGLITVQKTVSDAVTYVRSKIKPQDMLVITGSFYTIGEAKGELQGTPPSLIRG